jgi:general secretion pathway protein G
MASALISKVGQPGLPHKHRGREGMTLIELIVSFTIILILSGMAVPLAKVKLRVQQERDLKYALQTMRAAIDKYNDYCYQGYFGAIKQGTFCYPESLEILVEGVKIQGADEKKMKILRFIPRDPFTTSTEWGLRSMQDDIKSTTWGGQNVFNVYTKSTEKAADGRAYAEW